MKKYRNFTLMELLLVMSIAGILLAVTLPAFSHITQGKRKTEAITVIASKLNLARSYAVSNRCYTAVIFPVNTGSSTSVPTLMNRTSLRACIVYHDKDTSGNDTYTFAKWLPEDAWEMLPDGVIIDELNNGIAVSGAKIDGTYLNQTADITAVGSWSVVFKPNGRVADAVGPDITVIEAVANPTVTGKFIEKQVDGNVQQSTYSVNPYTGKGKTMYSERAVTN